MEFTLHPRQHISVERSHVTFYHNHIDRITLSKCQFENFNDIVYDLKSIPLKRYPLEKGVWLTHKDDHCMLATAESYFVFYSISWQCYIRRVHPRIRIILRYGECAGHKHHAQH